MLCDLHTNLANILFLYNKQSETLKMKHLVMCPLSCDEKACRAWIEI